jgi:ABC-type transport system involved in cytochrome c biogenesis permease component
MGGMWNQTWTNLTPALQYTWLQRTGILAAGSLLLFLLTIQLAALQVRRIWRDEPASARQLWFLATFCTPRFWRSMFRSKMSRKLQRNPIGWLQQYSWSDRLTKWAWCLLIVVTECLLLSDSQLTLLWRGQFALGPLLLLGLAFTASGSFRSERQTGALELLLVTPLREGHIIGGRVRGIWSQFFPAGLVLGFSWLYLLKDARVYAGYDYANANAWSFLVFPLFFVTSYCTVPVIGLHFSLQRMNFIAGWLLTFGFGLLLPMLVYGFSVTIGRTVAASVYALLATQFVLGFVALFLLKKTLRRRSFLVKGDF